MRVGDRVKVIAVPKNEPDYVNVLGKYGTVRSDIFDEEWVMVLIDGDKGPCDFKVGELEVVPPNVTVLEGKVDAFIDNGWRVIIDENNLAERFKDYDGKKVRVTIEVLEEG